jgi:thiol:disulfide interchange protein
MALNKNWLKVAKGSLIAGVSGSVLLTLISLGLYSFEIKTSKENLVDKGIHFETEDWNIILDKAKIEDKLIFLNLYATWCGPCKMMKVYTLSNKDVAGFFNENYINVSLDGEKGKGLEIMEKYKLRSFPSYLFIDGDDKVVAQVSGYFPPKDFIVIGKSIHEKIVKPS